MSQKDLSWVVCQIGAREHYAIPRALNGRRQLSCLITDAWMPPGSPLRNLPLNKRLQDRWHDDLADAIVLAPTERMLAFEASLRLRKRDPWTGIARRNQLFQKEAIRRLPNSPANSATTLFSYSYAALELIREAKRRGWQTVLGQIDPGPSENTLVRQLREQHPEWNELPEQSPPENYWDSWREECSLADRIIVNSSWSRRLLIEDGVDGRKIEIAPLALGNQSKASSAGASSAPSLPLRLLFLGQAILRKGIHDLAEAARALDPGKWQINVVGPHGRLPDGLPACLQFHGAVPRSEAAKWYADSDIFILPTHSDGFALTQLEAMSHGLPVIATSCCGEVVQDRVNGWLIPSGDPNSLSKLLLRIQENPQILLPMQAAAKRTSHCFGLDRVAQALLRI